MKVPGVVDAARAPIGLDHAVLVRRALGGTFHAHARAALPCLPGKCTLNGPAPSAPLLLGVPVSIVLTARVLCRAVRLRALAAGGSTFCHGDSAFRGA